MKTIIVELTAALEAGLPEVTIVDLGNENLSDKELTVLAANSKVKNGTNKKRNYGTGKNPIQNIWIAKNGRAVMTMIIKDRDDGDREKTRTVPCDAVLAIA